MITLKKTLFVAVASMWPAADASVAVAQHSDVLAQSANLRLATGGADFDTGQWTLGRRTYARDFDSDYAVSNPGFNSLAASSPSLPPGADALPSLTPLRWDFLPTKIDGAVSNLWYWNGVGATVDFGPPPTMAYRLSLFGKNAAVAVDGTSALTPGDVIDDTSSNGSLHRHRFFFLDDGDANAATNPADGIYLIAMRLTMAGLDSSPPIYFVWGTPGSRLAARTAAEAWVDARVDDLAPDFDGDFDGDLDVDGADLLAWQRSLGLTSGALHASGDANRDRAVTNADLSVWRNALGSDLTTFPGAATSAVAVAIPEPWIAMQAPICLMIVARWRRRPGG